MRYLVFSADLAVASESSERIVPLPQDFPDLCLIVIDFVVADAPPESRTGPLERPHHLLPDDLRGQWGIV